MNSDTITALKPAPFTLWVVGVREENSSVNWWKAIRPSLLGIYLDPVSLHYDYYSGSYNGAHDFFAEANLYVHLYGYKVT
ncbi:MAG: hypothetical protein V4630_18070 [Pseudomonadota bacterium]